MEFKGNVPVQSAEIARFETETGFALPADYAAFLRRSDGGKGYIGPNAYAAFWRLSELAEMNKAYQVDDYAPGLFIFGSNCGGEAYAFDARTPAKPIVRVPFVGMALNLAEELAPGFQKFLEDRAGSEESSLPVEIRSAGIPECELEEIFEIQPIIFGGSPTDLMNKTILSRPQHIELVRYWNKLLRDVRRQQ